MHRVLPAVPVSVCRLFNKTWRAITEVSSSLQQTNAFPSRVVFRVIRKSASDALVGCFFGLGCYFLDTSLKLEFDTLKTVRN